MSSPPLDLEIPNLQQQTIRTLERINHYIITTPNQDESKKIIYQEQITQQIGSVKNLEMVMSIVAPMKAGKSTIINALIGQEVMPTHGSAMTTFPTEVVFDSTLTQPSLILTPQTLTIFQNTISILKQKIDSQGIDWAKETTKKYSHLEPLLEKISDGIELVEKITGNEQINHILTDLNHIIRLSTLLDPNYQPLKDIKRFPRVETPFCSQNSSGLTHGKLVIVDTPGPNEAGQSGIREIVNTQLQKSASVLVVLDFTTLDGEEAARIKEEVKEIINLRGKNNLYIVVNKVDVRENKETKHRTPEQVRKFINSEFDFYNDNHIFEVSAQRAFYATTVLRELSNQPATLSQQTIIGMEQTQKLVEKSYGTRWKKTFASASLSKKELETDAQQIRTESGFSGLLQQITALIPIAEHHCMRTSLSIGSKAIRELYNTPPLLIDRVRESYDKLNM